MAPTVYPTPILLVGSITAQAGVAAPNGLDTSLMLVNTDRAPMNVTGIRFEATTPVASGFYYSDFIRVRVRVGSDYLTSGFVPLPLLASPVDRLAGVGGYWTWRFPLPMLLKPQERLVVEAVYFNPVTQIEEPLPAGSAVRIGVVGSAASTRVLPGAVRNVPYAAAYLAPEINFDGGAFSAESSESHLNNPFRVPLYAERITSALWLRLPASGGLWDVQKTGAGYFARRILVHLEDAKRLAITANPVPFPNLVDTLRGAWMIRTHLPARHFFLAKLTGTVSGGANDRYMTPGFGLVGSRQERI